MDNLLGVQIFKENSLKKENFFLFSNKKEKLLKNTKNLKNCPINGNFSIKSVDFRLFFCYNRHIEH